MITISNQTTRTTAVLTNGKRLTSLRAASTGLTRTSWINFHEHTSGALSLVREHEKKVGPSGIVDRLTQIATSKTFDVQVFNNYQTISVDNLTRLLMVKVLSLVANVVIKPLKQQDCFTSTVRSFLSASYSTLQPSKFRFGYAEPARVVDFSSVAQGCKGVQTYVYADSVRTERQWLRVGTDNKECEPSSGFTLNRQRLYLAFEWSVTFDSYLADFRQSQSIPTKHLSYLTKGDTAKPSGGTESWIAGFLALLNPSKESTKSKVNPLQYASQYSRVYCRDIWTERFNLGQLRTLRKVTNRLPFNFPRIAPFLNGGIVKLAAQFKLSIEYFFLPFRWVDAIVKSSMQGGLILTQNRGET